MKMFNIKTGLAPSALAGAVLFALVPTISLAQNTNPWASGAGTAPVAVQEAPKPEVSRYAPADLEEKLSNRAPAQPAYQAPAPQVSVPQITGNYVPGYGRSQGYPNSAPGYGGYPQGYGFGGPGYGYGGFPQGYGNYGNGFIPGYGSGSPYGSNGYPGGFGGIWPGGGSPFGGFSPFGFF